MALPNEHGAWAFVLEPALLGLLTWPSWAGGWMALAGLSALLVQHPLSLVLADLRRKKWYPRTRLATIFALAYAASMAVATLLAALGAARVDAFWLALPAAPLALLQLGFDARNQGRQLGPELAGSVAMASLVAMIARLAGAPWGVALVPWAVLAARNVASIVYVRARLERQRGVPQGQRPVRAAAVHLAHAASLAGVVALAALGLTPWWAVAAFAVLSARVLLGLRAGAPAVPAKRVGLMEMAFGLLVVVSLALPFGGGGGSATVPGWDATPAASIASRWPR